MSRGQIVAGTFLIIVAGLSLGADAFAPHAPEEQFRKAASAPPSKTFPLGTDSLGRDRWSRLLHGSRVSLLCAPAAAAVAVVLGTVVGLLAGFVGGLLDQAASAVTELVLSLPWLFLLLTLRAALPLNISPAASLGATFLLLAVTGWAVGARVVRGTVERLRASGPVQYARACGCPRFRLLRVHVLPHVRGAVIAQFWILVPVFLIAEANLSMLGLGVTEPMPSLGNMLTELRQYDHIPEAPWILAPAALLAMIVASLHVVVTEKHP
jgi:peptide/nickel transport system permease protein